MDLDDLDDLDDPETWPVAASLDEDAAVRRARAQLAGGADTVPVRAIGDAPTRLPWWRVVVAALQYHRSRWPGRCEGRR